MINIMELCAMSTKDGGRALLDFLMDINAIPKQLSCPKCNNSMKIRKDGTRFKWECNGLIKKPKQRPERCRYSKSTTSQTFFSNSHLSLLQICIFVILWLQNAALKLIRNEVKAARHTLVDWASFCREVCFDFIMKYQVLLGGEGEICEIDESKFGKRKYHRGKRVEGQWVFGILERKTGRVVLVPVERRDKETLLPIIEKYVKKGTIIMSDCWKSYDCLEDAGYVHLKVNHKLSFIVPDTGACTNRIEATWRAVKSSYSSSSRRKYFFGGYLAKYAFLKHCKINYLDPFLSFMSHASTLYTPLTTTQNPSASENVNDNEDLDEDYEDDDYCK